MVTFGKWYIYLYVHFIYMCISLKNEKNESVLYTDTKVFHNLLWEKKEVVVWNKSRRIFPYLILLNIYLINII